jgi:hypothetical protein
MFYEAELAAMNPVAALALKKVMDDKIAKRLLDLFNSPEYADAKVNHRCARTFQQFEQFLHPVVYPIRLIEDLKATKLQGSKLTYLELLFRLEMDQETLNYIFSPREIIVEIIALLQTIKESGNIIPTEYTPRRKTDYDDFYELMRALNASAELLSRELNIPKNLNFLRDIASNKMMFYVPGESRRGTGFLGIAQKTGKLAQVENGMRYQLFLRDNGISRENGRAFL